MLMTMVVATVVGMATATDGDGDNDGDDVDDTCKLFFSLTQAPAAPVDTLLAFSALGCPSAVAEISCDRETSEGR